MYSSPTYISMMWVKKNDYWESICYRYSKLKLFHFWAKKCSTLVKFCDNSLMISAVPLILSETFFLLFFQIANIANTILWIVSRFLAALPVLRFMLSCRRLWSLFLSAYCPVLSNRFCGETGFWTCQPILSVYQRYNIKVKNKCSKIVAHFWRLFETLLNAYAIILSRFKDTKKRTHCQMLYNKYFQPLHCYTF